MSDDAITLSDGDGDGDVRVRVFGPVTVDGRGVTRAQGAIIATLALRPGDAFTTEALIHAVWPEGVPASARSSLQNQLARLRSTFGGDLIETSREGYRLRATTDVQVFERTVGLACGTGTPHEEVIALLRPVLGLWLGAPFDALLDHPEAQCEASRLGLLRRRAEVLLATARIEGGHRDAAIAQLTVMVDAEPYCEQSWELLIRALLETGRRGEALAAHERMCARFRDDLAAEPSEALVRLGERIRRDSRSVSPSRAAPGDAIPSSRPTSACANQVRMREYGRCSGSYSTHRTRDGAE